MFSQEYLYDAKVFLRSYYDAIECIKQSADRTESLRRYEAVMNKILQAKNADEIEAGGVTKGSKLKEMKEYKLFQFSNYVFKKYFPTFDGYTGDYDGLKKILNEGYANLKKDAGEQ